MSFPSLFLFPFIGGIGRCRQRQSRLIEKAGFLVVVEIILIAGEERWQILNHQHVFRVVMFGGIAEVKAAGHDR